MKQDNAEAYNNKGIAYNTLGLYNLAIDDFNKAISLKQNFVYAYNNRGVVYLTHGNQELGCLDVKKACELGDCSTLEQAKIKGYCH